MSGRVRGGQAIALYVEQQTPDQTLAFEASLARRVKRANPATRLAIDLMVESLLTALGETAEVASH